MVHEPEAALKDERAQFIWDALEDARWSFEAGEYPRESQMVAAQDALARLMDEVFRLRLLENKGAS